MAVPESDGAVLVQQVGSCFVLRGPEGLTAEQNDWIGRLQVDAGVTLVLVLSEQTAQIGPALGAVLQQMNGDRLVLALSGAGAPQRDRKALAQQIADDWKLAVVAPSGDVVLTPGGTLFVPPAGSGQWWTFVAGERPSPLGPRWPVPEWAPADEVIALGALELRPVPAGMLLCPRGSAGPDSEGLAYAVPAWPERPAILAADLPGQIPGALQLLSLLLERPAWTRHPLLLVPAGDADVLPLGRAAARELGVRVEVLSGFPLAGRASADREQVVLADAKGRIAWSPFISSVLCRPDGSAPVPLIWRAPGPGLHPIDPVRPVYALAPDVHLTLTRAGLWLHEPGEALPPQESVTLGAVKVRLDVGVPEAGLPENLPGVLDELIARLEKEIRARLVITVQSALATEARSGLAEEAARHGVGIEFAGPPVDQVVPLRRSTSAEREQVRALIGEHWDEQALIVRSAFERLPVLGEEDPAAATVDLMALSRFLSGDETMLATEAYRACVTSALSRLPTYRGPVFCDADADADADTDAGLPAPGPGIPVRGSSRPPVPGSPRYVVWSQTARILEPLLPTGPTASIAGDLMFVPGTRLVVLEAVGEDVVLLQEVPEGGAVPPDARERLREVLALL